MLVELTKNENNEVTGYKIEAQTPEENLTLGSIRNMLFWGFEDTALKYNGMVEDKPQPGDKAGRVKSVSFIQKKYQQH